MHRRAIAFTLLMGSSIQIESTTVPKETLPTNLCAFCRWTAGCMLSWLMTEPEKRSFVQDFGAR